MHFATIGTFASLALQVIAQGSSSAAGGCTCPLLVATSSPAPFALPAVGSSAPASATAASGFFPSVSSNNTLLSQTNQSINAITAPTGPTQTVHDATRTNGLVNTAGGNAAPSSVIPGAAAPTAGSGLVAAGVVGAAAFGVAALL